MDIKQYTDINYIPISELNGLDDVFISETKKYRQNFVKIIEIDELHFANLIETPDLIKKRFIKNVDIKGMLNLKPTNNDYILELAKRIVNDNLPAGIKIVKKAELLDLYKKNNKDLTIIISYLIKNIDTLISLNVSGDINRYLPELSKNEIKFIKKHNNKSLNYSLSDFQLFTKCSYETARKSMDKLKELLLFKKQKIGKKFLYQPSEKLSTILKGDA